MIRDRAKSPPCKDRVVLSDGDLDDVEYYGLPEPSNTSQSTLSQTDHFSDQVEESTAYQLPSLSEQTVALAEEYPSAYIPIDVTGNSFQRMSSFRRSLIHVSFTTPFFNEPFKETFICWKKALFSYAWASRSHKWQRAWGSSIKSTGKDELDGEKLCAWELECSRQSSLIWL